MSYPYYGYQQPQYYQPPMADQLSQLRQQQYIPQQMPQAQPQQAQAGGQSMVWVSGEAEAMAYLVVPNSAVALWDSTAPVIYLKQADASGKPSLKVYDLVERSVGGARTAQAAQGEEVCHQGGPGGPGGPRGRFDGAESDHQEEREGGCRMNPFFGVMGGGRQPNMMQQFHSFMQQMRGKDPNAMIQEMVQSGRISQEQLNQVQQQALQMSGVFDGMRSMFGK